MPNTRKRSRRFLVPSWKTKPPALFLTWSSRACSRCGVEVRFGRLFRSDFDIGCVPFACDPMFHSFCVLAIMWFNHIFSAASLFGVLPEEYWPHVQCDRYIVPESPT